MMMMMMRMVQLMSFLKPNSCELLIRNEKYHRKAQHESQLATYKHVALNELVVFTEWCKKVIPLFYFAITSNKCTPILTIFSLL